MGIGIVYNSSLKLFKYYGNIIYLITDSRDVLQNPIRMLSIFLSLVKYIQ